MNRTRRPVRTRSALYCGLIGLVLVTTACRSPPPPSQAEGSRPTPTPECPTGTYPLDSLCVHRGRHFERLLGGPGRVPVGARLRRRHRKGGGARRISIVPMK